MASFSARSGRLAGFEVVVLSGRQVTGVRPGPVLHLDQQLVAHQEVVAAVLALPERRLELEGAEALLPPFRVAGLDRLDQPVV